MTGLPPATAVGAVDVPRLADWLGRHTSDLVEDLVTLARLETPSDDLELLAQGLKHVEEWVVERLGEPVARAHHVSPSYGAVLVLDFPGVGEQQLVGLAHYDTVFDAGTLESWPVRVDGDRISGPGVFDMKGGLVQLVWALRCLARLDLPRPPLRLVLNGDEEIGSPFSRALLEQACAGARAALVLEASADGAVKTARKGVGLFDVTAHGVESHAGLDPEAGASAVDEIARVISRLHEGADLTRGTSINVGTVHGGTRANVMAGYARAILDVRVATAEEQARVEGLLAFAATPRPAVPHRGRPGGGTARSCPAATTSPTCTRSPAPSLPGPGWSSLRPLSGAPVTGTSLRRRGSRCSTDWVPLEEARTPGPSTSARQGW